MNQRQRTRTINQLRQGEIRVLVATDVAARGIDVSTITHVINFDLPNNAEDYVHRIGRTGRAGSNGIALSFAAGRDLINVRKIEQFTGQKITLHSIPGLEPKSKMTAVAPAKKRPSSRDKVRHHSSPDARRGRASSPRGKPAGRFSGKKT
jgi:superfamily II DNA/RNA helicase